MADEISKTDEEWQNDLTPEQYSVCRLGGTEPAFTGQYWNCKEDGVYRCVCCGNELFDSGAKFDSGSGWPSFFEALDPERVTAQTDDSHGMHRIEVKCGRCDAHLGHVFPDGPQPSGQRYCINSAALDLEQKSDE